jgi:hypothetical protein
MVAALGWYDFVEGLSSKADLLWLALDRGTE